MNDPQSSPNPRDPGDAVSRQDLMSALFANMIVQQSNMALIFLGKVPHPETGERVQDIEAAQMFIDQLEMLEAKTKGNLDRREEGLLKQSLMTLRMAFVEAVEHAPAAAESQSKKEPAPTGDAGATTASAEETRQPASAAGSTEEAESRKKFTKKY
jgi:Domain of unknown function (DUF1844)